MRIAGVVAEYNPFHNGHKYHLEQTRLMGATHIVAVMSGAAVQRGDIAVADKFERARIAVENGADLVIELPCPYSCSSAERFASAAIQLLAGLGKDTVSMLSFGCETDDIRILRKGAQLSLELSDSQLVRDQLEKGVSYPAAMAAAAGIPAMARVFESPNDLLAIEYIKAIGKYCPRVEPVPVRRSGAAHDSSMTSKNIASASHIRELIAAGEDYDDFVPSKLSGEPFLLENSAKAVLLKIMTAENGELSRLPDMTSHLVRRFINTRDTQCELIRCPEDFARLFKNRSITLARVRRMIMYLSLGVTSRDLFDVPYGRILAFNDRGREILAASRETSVGYDTSLSKLEKISSRAARISELERCAVNLQQLSVKGRPDFVSDYTRKIVLLR